MNTRTPLAELPAMNDLVIGPDGETFGQLKRAVVDARIAYTLCPTDSHELARLGDELAEANSRLREAYAAVGLPYQPA
jgi:hypothetical protein